MKIRIGSILKCTRLSGEVFTCKVIKKTKSEALGDTIYSMIFLDSGNKGKDTYILKSEIDSSVEVLTY